MARYRDGNVTVELDGALERVARRAVDAVLPGVLERMETEVGDVLTTARGEWPVETGRSRAGLQMVLEVSDTSAKVAIENDVAYAKMVRRADYYGATTSWARTVQQPMRAGLRDLARELGPQIVAALRGG